MRMCEFRPVAAQFGGCLTIPAPPGRILQTEIDFGPVRELAAINNLVQCLA
jgi:hypothetical protein